MFKCTAIFFTTLVSQKVFCQAFKTHMFLLQKDLYQKKLKSVRPRVCLKETSKLDEKITIFNCDVFVSNSLKSFK